MTEEWRERLPTIGTRSMRIAFVLVSLLLFGACTTGRSSTATGSPAERHGSQDRRTFPPAPAVPDGPVDPRVARALNQLVSSAATDAGLDQDALDSVAASGDARLSWILSDLLRFAAGSHEQDLLVAAFASLTGANLQRESFAASPWVTVTDHLIAWDLAAPPGYRELKARLFLSVEPGWEPFFADSDADIDWRLVSWGGVFIDDRPLSDLRPCGGCIPALDDPALTPANTGGWYPDDAIVFAVVVGDQAVAFPRNIMEVHELVNISIGSKRLGIPYCTLCASAQAYLTDSVPPSFEAPVLRTSGLLSRSNKVMYDLNTLSVIDTFTGRALSGPLQDERVALEQVTVVASRWGEWKEAHPESMIVAEDGGLGRSYPMDPLGGRDDNGPIFPVGPVDSRLPAQSLVVGVIAPDGTPIAFPVDQARAALARGDRVVVDEVELFTDGGGLRAGEAGGRELPAHQSFWFAWSQFHPRTLLWAGR